MAYQSLLRAVERKVIDEVCSQNVTPVGNGRTVIIPEITSDLRKRGAAGTAIGRIGGQAVRPGVGNVDHGVSGKPFLQLRLQRMVVGRKEVQEEQPGTVSSVGTKSIQPVGLCSAVDRRGDNHGAAASDGASRSVGAGARKTRSRGRAVQIGCYGSLVEILEARKMDAVTAIVADIGQPGSGKLALNVQAPLLRISRLVINRHSGLDGERSRGSDGCGCTGRGREGGAVDAQVCQEALA